MAKTAVLLANLGSPDSYAVSDVKKYLREFLMDGRVIDIPYLFRSLLVKRIIVPFRSPKSAAKYQTIWTKNGSPLIHISRQVQQALAQKMQIQVELCMRYGNPTTEMALQKLQDENPDLKEVVLVPLYPHYAMSSYETAVVHVERVYKSKNYSFSLKVVPPFYNHAKFVQALSNRIKPYLGETFDHVLFSYHGIPERHVRKTDKSKSICLINENCCDVTSASHQTCYRHQVHMTTKLTAEKLGLEKGKFSTSFQSRLGADAWLRPYTVEQLTLFPKQGIKNLVVLCPAFVSDCLETLEEIQMEGKEVFLRSGGEKFTLVPCLNDQEEWIETLEALVTERL